MLCNKASFNSKYFIYLCLTDGGVEDNISIILSTTIKTQEKPFTKKTAIQKHQESSYWTDSFVDLFNMLNTLLKLRSASFLLLFYLAQKVHSTKNKKMFKTIHYVFKTAAETVWQLLLNNIFTDDMLVDLLKKQHHHYM